MPTFAPPTGPPYLDDPHDDARSYERAGNFKRDTLPSGPSTERVASTSLPPATAAGTLARTPLTHLLVYMLDKRLTGTAVLHGPDGSSHGIFLQDGVPAKVRADSTRDTLDRVLMDLGILDEDTLRETLLETWSRPTLHGDLLVEKGLIDPGTLVDALGAQLVRKLTRLFELPASTRYAFYDGMNLLASYGGPESVPCEPLAVIMNGARLFEEDGIVEHALLRLGGERVRLHAGAEVQRFALAPEELAVADALRARAMAVPELLAAGFGNPRAVKRTLYAFAITRHLEVGAGSKPPIGLEPSSAGAPSARESIGPASGSVPRRRDALSSPAPPRPSDLSPSPSARRNAIPPPPLSPARLASPASLHAARVRTPASATLPSNRDLAARRLDIEQRAASIDREDYFQMLGVSPDASPDRIQAAYFARALAYHPDRQPPELADLTDKVSMLFSRYVEAYQTLSDGPRRLEYERALARGAGTPEERHVARVVDAALEFQKAEILLKKHDIAGAELLAARAVEADPEQTEAATLLVWIQAQRRGQPPPLRPGEISSFYDDLIRKLDLILQKEPRYERALFYRGTLHKRSGRHDKAIRDFKLAADLNPRNVDAAREVRLHEMRSNPRGLLGKFFKK